MKKTALILSAGALLAINANAQIIISGIIDGDNSNPKGIEIYIASTGSYEGYYVGIQSNANTTWSNGYTFDDTIYSAGDYIYLTSTDDTLTSWGWDSKGTIISDGSFNQNGDDRFAIFNQVEVMQDIYGVDGQDGTGQPWEYTDSYAYRNSNSGPSTTFNISDWTVGGPDFLETVPDGQQAFLTDTFGNFTAVPEPQTYAVIAGLMVLGLAVYRRRK